MQKPTAQKSAARKQAKPMSEQSIVSLVEKLYPYHYRVNGPGNDEALPAYLEELDFTIHEFEEEQELNGWLIPRSEVVTKAEIRKDGTLIYDGTASPLGTILMCTPFKGELSREALQEHLHYHSENPEAIPFHCTQQYRPGQNTWGFCLPKTLYETLEDGRYDIDIEVEHQPTTMKTLDFTLPGKSDETIVFQAHNCHPFQANDDISGCAVGMRLMQALAEDKNRHYSYRLLICPELTGTLFWLDKVIKEGTKIVGAVILPAVGNNSDLKLQESFTGQSFLDKAAHQVFRKRYGTYKSGPFRTIYGNDETVFDAAGYEIPTISMTRYPFPNYHSQLDTIDIVEEGKLVDTLEALQEIIEVIENAQYLTFTGKGLYCLSHPRYELYKQVWDPSDKNGPKTREEGRAWNLLMTELPRRLDGQTSIYDLAQDYNLPANEVHEYCMQWVERGLAQVKG